MQENPTVPHVWLLLSNAITAILTVAGTLSALWFKRKREPAEIRRIDAETHSLTVTTEIAAMGITRETLREIQEVISKAEKRREEWHSKEEQMRTQIIFWRNKAEEFDGKLIDLRDEIAQLETRYNMKKGDLEKAMGIIKGHHLSFAELDQPKDS